MSTPGLNNPELDDSVRSNRAPEDNFSADDRLSGPSALSFTRANTESNLAANAALEQSGVIPACHFFDSVEDGDSEDVDTEDGDTEDESENQEESVVALLDVTPSVDGTQGRVFREDGSVEYSHDQFADGSTQFTRYFDMEVAGPGAPQESTTVYPDGTSVYRTYSPAGDAELVQQTDANGYVSTYTRQPDGSYSAVFNGPDGEVGEGTFDANLNPRETTMRLANGEVNRTNHDAAGGSTSVTRRPDGTEITVSRDPSGFDVATNIINPDGSETIEARQPNGDTVRQQYSPSGTLTGTTTIPRTPGTFRNKAELYLSWGSAR